MWLSLHTTNAGSAICNLIKANWYCFIVAPFWKEVWTRVNKIRHTKWIFWIIHMILTTYPKFGSYPLHLGYGSQKLPGSHTSRALKQKTPPPSNWYMRLSNPLWKPSRIVAITIHNISWRGVPRRHFAWSKEALSAHQHGASQQVPSCSSVLAEEDVFFPLYLFFTLCRILYPLIFFFLNPQAPDVHAFPHKGMHVTMVAVQHFARTCS